MYRYLVLVAICLASMTVGNYALAGHHGRGGHCGAVCPKCSAYCEFTAEETAEEKTCWQVECEDICVPRVVFPWQIKRAHHRSGANCCNACTSGRGVCTCVNNGAWVKTIKKLKKHTYECPTCQYEWTPKRICCGGGCVAENGACESDAIQWQEVEGGEPVETSEEAATVESAKRTPAAPSSHMLSKKEKSGNRLKTRFASLRFPFPIITKWQEPRNPTRSPHRCLQSGATRPTIP